MCRLTALVGIKKSKQLQADWKQTDENAVDFIKNKPDIARTIDLIEALQSRCTQLESQVEVMDKEIFNLEERIKALENK